MVNHRYRHGKEPVGEPADLTALVGSERSRELVHVLQGATYPLEFVLLVPSPRLPRSRCAGGKATDLTAVRHPRALSGFDVHGPCGWPHEQPKRGASLLSDTAAGQKHPWRGGWPGQPSQQMRSMRMKGRRGMKRREEGGGP
eukprot:751345-Hanusia_phi.AAC.2